METKHYEFLSGVRAVLPILVGVIPFGMIYGVLALGAGLSHSTAQAMSAVVFAGSAQLIVAQLVGVSRSGNRVDRLHCKPAPRTVQRLACTVFTEVEFSMEMVAGIPADG